MNEEAREALAYAASRVDGVIVTPYFRQTTKSGQGAVRLERIFPDASGFGFMATWQVLIQLPSSDIGGAEKWIDSHLQELIQEVEKELVITSIQPQTMALENGSVYVLVIEGNRGME